MSYVKAILVSLIIFLLITSPLWILVGWKWGLSATLFLLGAGIFRLIRHEAELKESNGTR